MITTAVTYRYWIDANDRIAFVNSPWLDFARENGAAELTQDYVQGRLLWDFVQGEETQQLYQAMVAKVRSEDRRMIVPFRCDSPTLRREMRMLLQRDGEGMVRFQCVVTQATPRGYLGLLDGRTRRTPQSLDICSCCLRLFVEPGGWTDIDDAVARLGLMDQQDAPQLRRTVCDACRQLA